MKDVYWISERENERLAIVARPRGGDWMEVDLVRMKHVGIDIVVSLLTAPEADELGLSDEGALAIQLGMAFFSYPIPDRHVPRNPAGFEEFITMLAGYIRNGRAIGIHCRGCIGRATITAASLLVQLGWNADTALEMIETARGCPVPDTPEQRDWILAQSGHHSGR